MFPLLDKVMLRNQWHIGLHQHHLKFKIPMQLNYNVLVFTHFYATANILYFSLQNDSNLSPYLVMKIFWVNILSLTYEPFAMNRYLVVLKRKLKEIVALWYSTVSNFDKYWRSRVQLWLRHWMPLVLCLCCCTPIALINIIQFSFHDELHWHEFVTTDSWRPLWLLSLSVWYVAVSMFAFQEKGFC